MNILLPLTIIVLVAVATAAPAQEGAAYTSEAIRQAQTSRLIPQNAQIQNVRTYFFPISYFYFVYFSFIEMSRFCG